MGGRMDDEVAAITLAFSIPAEAVSALEAAWSRRAATTFPEGEAAASPPPEREAAPRLRVADRYEDLGRIGEGGMGEVRRVRDVELERVLAMKIVHADLLRRPSALARFVEEAQATAQLQHPNIVPVHDIGRLPDGRVWFTMKEVRGRTLSEVIAGVHRGGASGWTLRRLVAAFESVCNAVAYAHDRGVVHRDLKPENAMVGDHGEVYVLDWGLAKLLGRPDPADDEPDLVRTSRLASGAHRTRMGQVAGTPAYMPPEQARGEVHRVDARSDVYALGAMLYEILSGRPPYSGDARGVVDQVLAGPPPPLETGEAGPAQELVDACARAMARDAGERFPTASALADEVRAWLDGARRREQALEVTSRALEGVAQAEALRERADALRAEGATALAGVAAWEPEEAKARGWDAAARAEAAEQAARLRELEVDQGLHAALRIAPDLVEAHAALASRYLARHASADAARDRRAAAELESRMAPHASALPAEHPVRREATAWLEGSGALTLLTDPPRAEVRLYRYVERNRRLVEVFERSLGATPLQAVPLPMGSYLCVLRHPDRAEVRYPVEITRRGHWDAVPPGASAPEPVWLPPQGAVPDDAVYVPAGWFRSGGDPTVTSFPAARLWCDALVMHRFPVTNRQYIAFLDDLVASGREEEALRHAPRERAATEGDLGAPIYGYEGSRFALRPDGDGDVWLPDWPVVMVDWHGARAYLAWLAARTGHPWRLPAELEWEKAARGVDGRTYPWGDHLDPSWACTMESHRGPRLLAEVDSYPVDTSPYGVRGLAGNAQDWCLDLEGAERVVDARVAVPEPGEQAASRTFRSVRGGTWDAGANYARSARRSRLGPWYRFSGNGFRGAYRPGGEG